MPSTFTLYQPARPQSVPGLAGLLFAGLLGAGPACAGDEAISTDRPDFVESSDVVGSGRFQIETGLTFERNTVASASRARTWTTPTLLRLGIGDTVELRAETDGYTRRRVQDLGSGLNERSSGYSDLSLGLKWRVQDGDEDSGRPGMAWLAHVDLASGSPALRGQGLRPSLRFVAEWDLPHDLSVGVMPGLVADKSEAGQRFVSGIFAVTVAKALAPGWHGFVEIAGQQLTSQKYGGNVVSFDTGLAYLLSNAVQVDLSLARGLNANTPDLQLSAGLSIKF